jgi:hypothetical protein
MLGRETCVDCGGLSPEINGDHTLTTSFGWRIRRALDAEGNVTIEWRCPGCWKLFKAGQRAGGAETATAAPQSSRDPRGGQA